MAEATGSPYVRGGDADRSRGALTQRLRDLLDSLTPGKETRMVEQGQGRQQSPIRASREIGDACLVELAGEIDLENAPEMRHGLLSLAEAKKPPRFVLNLQDVPYMDSSAIAVLIELLRLVRKWNGKLILFGLQRRVQGLVEISRLDSVLTIVADEQQALQ